MFLALLRREIEDYAYGLIGSLVCGLFFAVMILLLCPEVTPEYAHIYQVLLFVLPVFAVGAGTMGATQMVNDRRTGTLAFLLTSRPAWTHILAAKWMAGLLGILTGMLPVVAATHIAFDRWTRLVPLDITLLHDMLLCIFWTALASYALGARITLKESKSATLRAVLATLGIVLSIVLIKGVGFGAHIAFLILAVAALVDLGYRLRERAW